MVIYHYYLGALLRHKYLISQTQNCTQAVQYCTWDIWLAKRAPLNQGGGAKFPNSDPCRRGRVAHRTSIARTPRIFCESFIPLFNTKWGSMVTFVWMILGDRIRITWDYVEILTIRISTPRRIRSAQPMRSRDKLRCQQSCCGPRSGGRVAARAVNKHK